MRFAIACFIALSVPSLAAGQTSQYIFGSQSGQPVFTSEQTWIGLMPRNDVDVSQNTPATGNTYALMPTTGTFSSFCVNLSAAPGTGASWIWTLYKNGLDEYLSVTISGTKTQACDLVDTAGFVPGDLVSLHVTPSSSPAPASTYASWYIVQTPAVPGETILFTSQDTQGGGGSSYFSLAGNSSSLGAETAMATIIPTAGTVTKFIAEEIGTGGTASATLDHNESPTTLSVSMPTSAVFVEQPADLSVSPGDVLDVFMTGFNSTQSVYASVVFVPNVPGQFVIPTWRNITTDADPLYYLPISGRSDDNLEPTEALAQQIGGNAQIEAVFVRDTVAPGSGAQYAYTLRDNGANTALNTTLSGTNMTACTTTVPVTGCATGSPVTINNLDLLDTSVVPTGNPATSANDYGAAVSYLAYVPQLAFTTQPPSTGSAGTVLSSVVVELQDSNRNPLSGSTAQVTISSSPAGVSGTLTVNAVNGVATFSNLSFATQGTYTLSAAAGGLIAITSNSISIGNGAPTASLTPSLVFPNTVEKTTATALVATLSNTGTSSLTGIVPSIVGPNPDDFAITTGTNACGASLAAGASCNYYITFTPSGAFGFSAALSVADNATGSPQITTLVGTGVPPANSVSLTQFLGFPNTTVKTTSAALAAVLTNTGSNTVTGIVPSIGGGNPDDFAITTGTNACGASLAAGASCNYYITFTPSGAFGFSAALSVADSATGSPQTTTLVGTGIPPASSVSLTPILIFPNTTVKTTAAALVATMTNNGGTAVTGIVPSIVGPNPDDFAITTGTNACGASLAAGASCNYYITFTPSVASGFSAALSVADSATSSPQTTTLVGTGIPPASSVSLTSILIFPNTTANTTSAALAATMTNNGATAVTGIVPSIVGPNPNDFTITTGTNACGASLAAGASCNYYITFTPTGVSGFSAALSVADSATGSPQTTTLVGSGQ